MLHTAESAISWFSYIKYFALQLSKDHSMMTQVLSGRHLRLKIASSLWKRSAGELLTYLLRYYSDTLETAVRGIVQFNLLADVNVTLYSKLNLKK